MRTNKRPARLAVVVACLALVFAAQKLRSANGCANRAGSINEGLDGQCANCLQREDGAWFKWWFFWQTNSCTGTQYSHSVGWDLSCGQYPQCYVLQDEIGFRENVTSRPLTGVCSLGTCSGTLGGATVEGDMTVWGAQDCN